MTVGPPTTVDDEALGHADLDKRDGSAENCAGAIAGGEVVQFEPASYHYSAASDDASMRPLLVGLGGLGVPSLVVADHLADVRQFGHVPPPTEQPHSHRIERPAHLLLGHLRVFPPSPLAVDRDESQNDERQRQTPDQPYVLPSLEVGQPASVLATQKACSTVANPAKGEKPGERGAGPSKPTSYWPGRKSQKWQQGKKKGGGSPQPSVAILHSAILSDPVIIRPTAEQNPTTGDVTDARSGPRYRSAK